MVGVVVQHFIGMLPRQKRGPSRFGHFSTSTQGPVLSCLLRPHHVIVLLNTAQYSTLLLITNCLTYQRLIRRAMMGLRKMIPPGFQLEVVFEKVQENTRRGDDWASSAWHEVFSVNVSSPSVPGIACLIVTRVMCTHWPWQELLSTPSVVVRCYSPLSVTASFSTEIRDILHNTCNIRLESFQRVRGELDHNFLFVRLANFIKDHLHNLCLHVLCEFLLRISPGWVGNGAAMRERLDAIHGLRRRRCEGTMCLCVPALKTWVEYAVIRPEDHD